MKKTKRNEEEEEDREVDHPNKRQNVWVPYFNLTKFVYINYIWVWLEIEFHAYSAIISTFEKNNFKKPLSPKMGTRASNCTTSIN